MAKHRKHDLPDLRDGLEHVIYEMWKFKQSVVDFGPIQVVGGDAALEFRVLPHRALLEFFYDYTPEKHPNNIFAWEYIDEWEQGHRSPIWCKKYMDRCHIMLAHISTERTKIARQGLKSWRSEWDVVEPVLHGTIAEFLRGSSEQYKGDCAYWINQWAHISPILTDLGASL